MTRPRIFIGSSVESKGIAEALADQIDREFEHVVWSDGVFTPGAYTLSDLRNVAKSVEYAVIVLGKDDITTSRDETKMSPRDNVIFELGLFMGALGEWSVLFLVPRDRKSLKIPSDLLGITPLEYDDARSDKNSRAAVGNAARRLIELKNSRKSDINPPVSDQPGEVSNSTQNSPHVVKKN